MAPGLHSLLAFQIVFGLLIACYTGPILAAFAELFPANRSLQPGEYRVVFKTGDYYKKANRETFFPEVPVIFQVKQADQHYHIPLLLSPYGFSTYRGS